MRLTPPPLEIGDRDGFDGTDIFGYEEFGRNLASLVENLEGPSVIALDGGWGSGKTVFAKQWAGLLRKRGSAVVYFDAFAADAGDDPLFDIASQLFVAAPEGEERKELARAAEVFARRLLPAVAAVGVRVATGGLIGGEAISAGTAAAAEAKKAATDHGEEISGAFRRRIEGAQGRADALSDFRQKLGALAEILRSKALANVGDATVAPRSRPVVMIVDELDRCKPSYALHLLENIKHVFDVESVCFVLVTNLRQLTQVVASQYGVTEADAYLEKFIHATFVLPEKERFARNRKYIRHLFKERMEVEANSSFREPIELSVSHAGTSLRGIERVIPNVAWCLAAGIFKVRDALGKWPSRNYAEILVPSVVCAIRALNPEMYARMRIHRMSSDEVVDFLRIRQWEVSGQYSKEQIEDVLRKAFPPKTALEGDSDAMQKWESGYVWHLVRQVCEVLEVLRDPATRRSS